MKELNAALERLMKNRGNLNARRYAFPLEPSALESAWVVGRSRRGRFGISCGRYAAGAATPVQAPSDPRPSPTVLRFVSVVSASAIYIE